MVGSGASDRSKEAVGMMALHEALRSVCLNSDWTYSVFWTIRPRPRSRGGNVCKVGDDNGSLMLMWEDGFCRGRVADCLEDIDGEDPVRKVFSKMSIQLYNYGEGLMGKVASDKCHKWVFKEPSECEPNISNYWQSSFDAIPPEWTDQFNSGIQTIAVIQAGHGLLQLGSCKIIPEDLHFVLRMRHTFESLGYQSGFYLSQLFSTNRNTSPSASSSKQFLAPSRPPAPIFKWSQSPLPSATSVFASPNFQNSSRLGLPQTKDETHLFLPPHSSETQMEDMNMMADHDSDIKWPNGLSFFNALTGRNDDAKLLFGHEGLENKIHQQHHQFVPGGEDSNSALNLRGNADESKTLSETPNSQSQHGNRSDNTGIANFSEYLSLESQSNNVRKMENKFKRSFTLPARMASSSSSTSLDHHSHHSIDYRSSDARIYSDIMDTFLE
ncbi:protein RICE SALT SENSITIVE 3-like isoform X2 [Telopea speciosissima]|uniref:protein RICE SALT SENSITIVE 3-like isoform X2 n=1 Tax=Telopea speciosissima TaxID=54955 RepID=UPI001CC44784|nr:protein RICE SALT SENSITIVE 3-like isoform X2 [Telopea speciosissima]